MLEAIRPPFDVLNKKCVIYCNNNITNSIRRPVILTINKLTPLLTDTRIMYLYAFKYN